jgi:hypothetical protein
MVARLQAALENRVANLSDDVVGGTEPSRLGEDVRGVARAQ